MRTARFYRYFLGVRPHPRLYPAFRELAEGAGQSVGFDTLHLTLCVIAECAARDPFVARRVERALEGHALHCLSGQSQPTGGRAAWGRGADIGPAG